MNQCFFHAHSFLRKPPISKKTSYKWLSKTYSNKNYFLFLAQTVYGWDFTCSKCYLAWMKNNQSTFCKINLYCMKIIIYKISEFQYLYHIHLSTYYTLRNSTIHQNNVIIKVEQIYIFVAYTLNLLLIFFTFLLKMCLRYNVW